MKNKAISASVSNETDLWFAGRLARRMARIGRQSVAILLSGVLVLQPALVQAQVAPDVGAPAANQPGIGAAPNGVPLVDIVTPNGQGLSHNKYGDFNVGTPGLILNNQNSELGTSKLGGVTPGNANLKNSGPATVILNEVTSGNRSSLLGPTEVFGGRADVIIANPNGITCDGCGFINTPRATLTTGTPDIDATGRLSGFTVQGGDVTFGSKGGNFASGDGAVDLFDIVSRRVQINGPVNGKNLRLTAGRSKFNYATGEATALDGADDAGEFAIDGSALGAMQADRIKIVVTDKGAGVRMRNDMAAHAGELSLSADGRISLGNVSGRDGVKIQSKRQVEAKKVTSKKRVVVKADKGITLDAVAADEDVVISAGEGLLSVASDVASLGNIELTSAGAIATGNVSAAKNVNLQSGQGISAGQVLADGGAKLTATSGNIALSGTAKAGGGALTVEAKSGSIQAASLVSFNNMTLSAGADIVTGGNILAGSDLIASARSIKAASTVSGIDFAATNAANGTITLGQNGDMRLTASGGAIDVATVLSAGKLDATGNAVISQNVTTHGDTRISGAANISGQMLSGSDIVINGPTINLGTAVAGVDIAALNNGNVVLSDNAHALTLIATAGDLTANRLLSSGDMVASSAGNLSANAVSHGNLDLTAGNQLTLLGQSLVAGNANLNAGSITIGSLVSGVDFAATEQAGGSLILNTADASKGQTVLAANAGSIVADQLISGGNFKATAAQNITYNSLQSFAAADLNALQGAISLDQETIAKGDITLTLQSFDLSNNRSKIATAGGLIVNAANANLANSTLTFGGLTLNLSGSADISGANVRAVTTDGGSGNIAIAASTVTTTSATALLAANDLTLTLASLTNAGQVAANNNLTFNIAGNFTNTPTGLIYAGQDGGLYVAGDLLNDQGAILVANDLTIAANANGRRNNSITNISGLIKAGRDAAITTANLTNKRLYVPGFTTVKLDPMTLATFILNPEVADQPFMHLYQGANDDKPSDYLFPDLPRQQWEDYQDRLWSQATLADGTSYRAWTWVSSQGPTSSEGIRDWIANRVPRDADGNVLLDPNNPSKYFVVVRQGKPADSSTTYEWDEAARISQVIYEDAFNGEASPEALIRSGRNLVIDSTVLNNSSSTIEAEGNAVLKGEILNNEGVMGTRKTMLECHARGACEAYDADGKKDPSKDMANGSSILVKTESFGLASGNIKAGGNLDISGFTTVSNKSGEGSVAGHVNIGASNPSTDPTDILKGLTAAGALYTPNAALGGLSPNGTPLTGADLLAALGASAPKPSSGGFGGTIPGQIFLYETRAEFLDVGKFYGSGYFIDRIGYKPDREVPFLGDAYFENELVDQQLRQLVNQGLGKGSFIPGSDAIEQMKVLLDRGADFAKANGLTIGEKLSPELIANLTETMVWYEKKTVNGIEVLVPTVYVANTDKANLTVAGALITGGSLTMNVNEVNNSGTIGAKTNLQIAAANITATGGSFTAGNDLSLSASQNLTLNAQTLTVGGQNVVNPNAMVDAGGNAALQAGEALKLQGAGVEVGGDAVLSGKNVTLDAQKVENSGSQNAMGTRINTGGDLGIKAENDVTVIGSSAKAGGALDVTAEKGSVNVVTTDVTRKTDDGYSRSTTTTQQQSQLSSGSDMSIKAEENVLISGSSVDSGGNASISAGRDVNITTAQESGSVTFGKNSGEMATHSGSEITAKGDISIAAGENGAGNLNIVGSKIAADQSVDLKAADNVTIAEARNTESYEFHAKTGKKATTDATLDIETASGSSISGKTGVNIGSGKDTTISASKVQAGDEDSKADLNIDVGGDLIVSSGKDMLDDQTKSKQKGFLSKTGWSSSVYDETTVASELSASGNVNLNADNNVAIAGSKVTAGENIAIEGDSVSIIGAQETDASSTSKKKSGLGAGSGDGFYSVWGKSEKSNTENIVSNVGSELSAGNDVTIKARETDVNIVGSKVEAGNDIALDAARDVNILPGAESYASEEKEKRSGFGVQFGSTNGGFSVGVGYGKSSDETRQGAETNAVSSLKAGNDITINAGRDANLQAAQIEAERDVGILAERDVNLLAAQDKTNYEHIHEKLFAGITAQVSSGLVSAAQGVADSMEAAGSKTGSQALANAAMATLYANKLKQGLEQIDKSNATSLSASVSVGFQSSKSEDRSESSTPVVTTIRGGQSVTIEAKSGDINSHGAQIVAGYDQYGLTTLSDSDKAGDITLIAGNNINLESAIATGSNSSEHSSFGAGVSVGFDVTVGEQGVNAKEVGVSVNANGSKGSAGQNAITHINTHVAGTGDVTLKSGNDTNLKGAVVSGESVTADVGGNLTIESQLDTATSKADNTSVSGSVGTGGFNVSGAVQNAKGDAVVVSEQSGIHAGSGGFDIKVDGDTKLKGGLITSEAPASNNRLETGTLQFEDLDTHSKWKAETYGGSIGSGGISVAPPIKEGESETGKALSAVSPAEIIITDPSRQQQNIDDLRRDTTNTNTSLPGLPDLQNILREQYKTQERYQEASAMMAQFVGDMADKLALEALKRGDIEAAEFWGAGGVGRAGLHAVGGGILGGVNDISGMIKGAFGGAASTLIAPYVDQLVNAIVNDAGLGGTDAGRSLANIVSGGIVMGLTSVIGGGDAAAYAGAEFRYNYLTHTQLTEAIENRKKLAECSTVYNTCSQAVRDELNRKDAAFMELSAQNTQSLITICQSQPSSESCKAKVNDLVEFSSRLKSEMFAGNDPYLGASGFSQKQSMFDYDLLLAQSLQSGKAPDVAVRDFFTDLAKKEGAVNSFLDGLGIVGGIAACSTGVGTAACVAGALAAIASANHLSADIQQAVTGKEAKTALVAALTSGGYTQAEAEKLQYYLDIGVIAVTVGVGGYKFVVDAKRLAKGDEALAKLNTAAPNRTPQIVINNQNGAEFEQQVVDAFGHVGGTKNTTAVTVTLENGTQVTTIPDLWQSSVGGLLEAKNVQNLSMSNQLRAQIQVATETGQPLNLVVSPRTQSVSGPLVSGVRSTGGNVYVYNPATDTLTLW
ncbi:hemagglutinin repeat-containing protein [Brucellaceae bacterium D45D]